MAALVATPPATSRARLTVAAEQATATRIDQLRTALTDTRLGIHIVRGQSRQTLRTELDQLVARHPTLDRPEQRQPCWDTMIAEARSADHDQASILRNQIDQAIADATEHTTVAEACRVERDIRAKTVNTIATQSASRSAGGSGLATYPCTPGQVPDVNVSAETAAQSPPARTVPEIHQQHRETVDPPAQDGPALKA